MSDSTKIIGDIAGVPNPKSDWLQNDERKADYIKNKPDLSAYANALKGNASGDVVGIKDISPIEHNLSVKLSSDTVTDLSTVTLMAMGKNILPYPYYSKMQTMNGVTFTVNDDGSVTANGLSCAGGIAGWQAWNCSGSNGHSLAFPDRSTPMIILFSIRKRY